LKRRLHYVLTALSLLLCLALAILFVADADSSREVEYVSARPAGGGRVWGAYCHDYRLYLGFIEGRSGTSVLDAGLSAHSYRGWTRSLLYFSLMYGPRARVWFRFGAADYPDADALFQGDLLGWQGARVRAVMIPAWFVLSALAVAPAAWLVRRLREGEKGEGDKKGEGDRREKGTEGRRGQSPIAAPKLEKGERDSHQLPPPSSCWRPANWSSANSVPSRPSTSSPASPATTRYWRTCRLRVTVAPTDRSVRDLRGLPEAWNPWPTNWVGLKPRPLRPCETSAPPSRARPSSPRCASPGTPGPARACRAAGISNVGGVS